MKILVLSDDFPPQSFGGAGIVAFNLARALQKDGHSLCIVTAVREKKDEGTLIYEDLTIHRIHSTYHERWRSYLSIYNPQVIKKIKKVITDFGPDVVHSHNIHYYLSYASLKIAKKSGAKVFLTAHDVMLFHYGKLTEFVDVNNPVCLDSYNYKVTPWQQIKTYRLRYNLFRNIAIKYYLRYVDKIFAVSNALMQALIQNGIENVTVVHNGINVDEWSVDSVSIEKFKVKFGLINKKVVLFGGRLSVAKGGNQAIRAFKEVVVEIPNAVLLIIGNKNQYAEQILKTAEKLDISKNIIFTGWISGVDLKSAYFSADVVLVPSIYLDPFPTINLEAMACKKPVIGTCFGGTQELVTDGITGYIINPYDVHKEALKISFILHNDEKAKFMGMNGNEYVKRKFSQEKQTQKILELYKY